MAVEAKEVTEAPQHGEKSGPVDDFDTKSEEFFGEEKETPAESSAAEKTKAPDTEPTPPAGAEPEKTEQVKEVEEDGSLSVEEKIAKVSEILKDDPEAIDAYVKEKGWHTDPAWKAQRAIIDRQQKELETRSALSEEEQGQLAMLKDVTSSAAFIKATGVEQGLTQEKINSNLVAAGHDPGAGAGPMDAIEIITTGLKTTKEALEAEGTLENAQSIAKVVDLIFTQRLKEFMPNIYKELDPVHEVVDSVKADRTASKNMAAMEALVKKDGVLEFEKDVLPILDKFIRENKGKPGVGQDQAVEYFRDNYHTLCVERMKGGKRKEERDDKKGSLRGNKPGVLVGGALHLPKSTGKFDPDADGYLNSRGVT